MTLVEGNLSMDVDSFRKDSSYTKWAVIMAGGIGERFWPLSTPEHPKQLLPFGKNGNTLLQESINRILPLVPKENIWLATSNELKPIFVSHQYLPEEQIIAEPCRKNTAGCLAYVMAHLIAKLGDGAEDIVMAVLTADQLIEPVDGFVQTVSVIMDYVAKENVLGIIGIPPTRPETGFGYIEAGENVYKKDEVQIYTVNKFHEKPNIQTAEQYVKAGNYLWNSGMFFWKVKTFLDEIQKTSPAHWEAIQQMSEKIQQQKIDEVYTIFQHLPDISIDYALMEHTGNIVMAKGIFQWDDLGSWTSLERIMPKDENGNVIQGEAIPFQTTNSIIYNDDSIPITIVPLGVDNLIIAVSHNIILVMDKKEAQNLKQVSEKVKKYLQEKKKP